MVATIAVLGLGAMGAGVGGCLAAGGANVISPFGGRSGESIARARSAGIRDATTADIAGADIILSIVPPGVAIKVAEDLAGALRASPKKPIYVDCNAVSPDTVRKVADVVEAAGVSLVDGGIIGLPPRAGHPGPRTYLSGQRAAEIAALERPGLRFRVLDDRIGTASAIKMCFGGLNKGLMALGAAMALAAERHGIGAALRAELEESQRAILLSLDAGVPRAFPKAYRWVAEMEEIAAFLGERPEARTYEGIAGLYDRIARDFASDGPETDALAAFYRESSPR